MGYNCARCSCVSFSDLMVVKSVGSVSERWRFKGPMSTTSKTRGALDKEVGLSDRDLFILKDYQALCFGTRAVFLEVPAELFAAKDWRVPCARRWKRPERIVKRPFGHIEQSGEKPFAGTSSLNPVRQKMSWVCAASKGRSSIWSPDVHASLCGLCLAFDASVRYRWFPSESNPADEPSRRFEWSAQYHARFRKTSSSRLPRH